MLADVALEGEDADGGVTMPNPRWRPDLSSTSVTRALPTLVASVLTTALLAGGTAALPTANAQQPARAAKVDGWPTTTPGRGRLPARAARRARRARRRPRTAPASRWSATAGWSTTGTGARPRTTPREVFSITKSITSALVGIAVRDGDLALDDRVVDATCRPGAAPTPQTVTVRDLLSNDQRPVLVDWTPTTTSSRTRSTGRRTPSAWASSSPAGHGLGVQQRRHPGARPRCCAGHRRRRPTSSPRTGCSGRSA